MTVSHPAPDERGPALITPMVCVLVLGVLAVLPLGLPSDARFVMPMLPLIAIHYWVLNNRGYVPATFVFVVGLAIDVITRGPLGFWSLIYLIVHMIASLLTGGLSDTRAKRWVGFVVVVALVAALQWAIASAYFLRWLDWAPFVTAACVVAPAYIVFSLSFGRGTVQKANA